MSFDLDGTERRSFSFSDQVSFKGVTYGPPWVMTSFGVDETGGDRRIAVAAHHHMWNPGLVTVLDDQWRRRGTFVHNGWVESLRWLAPNRLLIAGFSNTHEGGMVALLDPSGKDGVDGQGPEPQGTDGYCDRCGPVRPLRMVILPRSPLNHAAGSPFNRAIVQVTGDRIIAHTFEVPPAQGATWVEGIYTFTRSLDLIDASYSDRYSEVERALVAEGRLRSRSNNDGARPGPQYIEVWQPDTGWTQQHIR